MKSSSIMYILIAVAFVCVAYVLIVGTPRSAEAPTTVPPEVTSEPADIPVTTESEQLSVPDADSEQESMPELGGHDVGMEFPEADKGMLEEAVSVKEFTVDAFNFGYSVNEIRVSEGDTVTITLTNSDGFHDWVVDEFDAATDKIPAGETTSVTFVADKAGTFEYYCSVGSHRAQGMVGTLVVE